MSKNNYVHLGAIVAGKDGGYYIKLQDDLKLNINGQAFNKKYINVEVPTAKLDRFLEKGFIDETEYEARAEKIPSYIKFELTAVLEG